jgi:hypothetical protein
MGAAFGDRLSSVQFAKKVVRDSRVDLSNGERSPPKTWLIMKNKGLNILQLRDLRRFFIVVLSVGFCLGGWAQTKSAARESPPLSSSDVERALSNPKMAAAVRFIERRLPGTQDTWYVVVLRIRDHGIKRLDTVLAFEKTTVAVQIANFLRQNPRIARNPKSFKQWLHVETFTHREAAESRYEAVNAYVHERGYR